MGWWQSVTGTIGNITSTIGNVIGQAGGVIGAAVGSVVPGVGTVVGGTIGGIVQNIVAGGEATAKPVTGGIGYTVTPPGYVEPKKGCFVATEVYGCRPPQKFYDFRDNLPSAFVKSYYILSPHLISIIRVTHSHKIVRALLNMIIR